MAIKHLPPEEIHKTATEIMILMDGIPLGQALYCLRLTKELLLDAHEVDVKSPRFQANLEEPYFLCHEIVFRHLSFLQGLELEKQEYFPIIFYP